MAANICARLARHFSNGDPDALSTKDASVFLELVELLEAYQTGSVMDVKRKDVIDTSDADWDPNADADEDEDDCPSGLRVQFSGSSKGVTPDHVAKALAFYRDTEKGFRQLSCMKNRCWFIRNDNDLKILRKFERDGLPAVLHRKSALKGEALLYRQIKQKAQEKR